MKQCVILNPHAGAARDENGAELRSSLHRLTTDIWELGPQTSAKQLVARAVDEQFDRIVVGGGDGTLNHVLNALDGQFDRVQLGLLPLGTANDFARSIHIPADPQQAIELLLRGELRAIDVGRLTTPDAETPRYFLNMAVGGFSTIAKEKLDETRKDLWKTLAYAVSAFKALPELTEYWLKIRFDDNFAVEIAAYNIAVANATYSGGGIPIAPEARLDDGLLDIVIFASGPFPVMLGVASQTFRGHHLDHEHIYYRQAKSVEIVSEPTFQLNTDGELIGCCPGHFEALAGALSFVVGPRTENE